MNEARIRDALRRARADRGRPHRGRDLAWVARTARARPRVAIGGPVALAAAAGRLTAHDTALCLERSIVGVVALFGGLKAGAASVPRDPGSPPARLACMLADAAAALRRAQPLRSGSGRARFLPTLLTEGHVGG